MEVIVDMVMVVEKKLRGRSDGLERERGRIGRKIGMKDKIEVLRKEMIERKRKIERKRNILKKREGGWKKDKLLIGIVMREDGRGMLGRNMIRSIVLGGRIGKRRRKLGNMN